MRQAGYLAACGIYALKNNIERLNEDHIKAKEIESVLKNSNFISQVEKVETNILIFQIEKSIKTDVFLNKMSNQNIKLISMGDNKLRLVTHKDYTNQMHEKFLDIISNLKF
jgi:threonine aldolase